MQFALDKIHIDFKFEFNGCYTLVSEKNQVNLRLLYTKKHTAKSFFLVSNYVIYRDQLFY